ncbi:MAG: hypothetical protein RBT52_06575 [Sulfurimonas sp.]|jgi:hypothetical protein|nr:hypothetical protein [Sulfurimonas sp.]
MRKPFNKRRFYYCFNCGLGEKGVSEYYIPFLEAFNIIKEKTSLDTANKWAEEENCNIELSNYHYIIDEYHFYESDWIGSQGYFLY